MEILRRPGVAVVVRRISRFVLAVGQAYDIIGVPLVVDVALLLGDDIVGRGQQRIDLEVCRMIHDATKRAQLHGRLLSFSPPCLLPLSRGRARVGDKMPSIHLIEAQGIVAKPTRLSTSVVADELRSPSPCRR